MNLSSIGDCQTTRYVQNKRAYQSNATTIFSKTVESETPANAKDSNSISIRPSSIGYLACFFRNAPPINEAELPEDHFTKSSEYEKMIDSITGVTYYKNKTKPEMQMAPDQVAIFYEFFGDDSIAAINRQRELSGTRKEYGDYTIELLGTNIDKAAIINHKDISILEFDISGDPNDIF